MYAYGHVGGRGGIAPRHVVLERRSGVVCGFVQPLHCQLLAGAAKVGFEFGHQRGERCGVPVACIVEFATMVEALTGTGSNRRQQPKCREAADLALDQRAVYQHLQLGCHRHSVCGWACTRGRAGQGEATVQHGQLFQQRCGVGIEIRQRAIDGVGEPPMPYVGSVGRFQGVQRGLHQSRQLVDRKHT